MLDFFNVHLFVELFYLWAHILATFLRQQLIANDTRARWPFSWNTGL